MDFGVSARMRFRGFPLDGALLFFQPATGNSVHVRNAQTRLFRRVAPRVVMFGITNHCNLRCAFCSRDHERTSAWSIETALQMLRGLERAGSLEVAFGGGEPFAFRGFHELIGELFESTALALNVTTNGTLLNARSFSPFEGRFGQVRLSIYDDPAWRSAARTLTYAGQLWGANVLVDSARLASLPRLFAELAALGCHDISILRFVGGDPNLQLDAAARTRLAALISDAPLPCRVSVCFGDLLPVPRLFDGADDSADCGAGYDFIGLTSDQRVQSCSFRDSSLPARTAAEVLAIWRERQAYLSRASRRVGCDRVEAKRTPGSAPQLALFRAFSGNNSGECILVGKFASSAAAKRYLAELTAGYVPDEEYSAEWRALFDNEQVLLSSTRDSGETWGQMPQSLVAVGNSVLAVGYDAGDAFPELRALTWKRSGFVAPGGIHQHDSPTLLAAIGCHNAEEVEQLAGQASRALSDCITYPHGPLLFIAIPKATREKDGSFSERVHALEALAAERPLSAELATDWDEAAFTEAKQRLGVELRSIPRLLVHFWGMDSGDHAKRFAARVNEAEARAYADCVLIEGITRRKRLAVLALRQGAFVTPLDSAEVDVWAHFWFLEPPRTKGKKAPPAPTPDLVALDLLLSTDIASPVRLERGRSWRNGVSARVVTAVPGDVLSAMVRAAAQLGMQVNLGVTNVDPLGLLVRRLVKDVTG